MRYRVEDELRFIELSARLSLGSNQEPRPSSVVGPESIGDEVQLGELGLVVAG